MSGIKGYSNLHPWTFWKSLFPQNINQFLSNFLCYTCNGCWRFKRTSEKIKCTFIPPRGNIQYISIRYYHHHLVWCCKYQYIVTASDQVKWLLNLPLTILAKIYLDLIGHKHKPHWIINIEDRNVIAYSSIFNMCWLKYK